MLILILGYIPAWIDGRTPDWCACSEPSTEMPHRCCSALAVVLAVLPAGVTEQAENVPRSILGIFTGVDGKSVAKQLPVDGDKPRDTFALTHEDVSHDIKLRGVNVRTGAEQGEERFVRSAEAGEGREEDEGWCWWGEEVRSLWVRLADERSF